MIQAIAQLVKPVVIMVGVKRYRMMNYLRLAVKM
jgi:hypothetical protein